MAFREVSVVQINEVLRRWLKVSPSEDRRGVGRRSQDRPSLRRGGGQAAGLIRDGGGEPS